MPSFRSLLVVTLPIVSAALSSAGPQTTGVAANDVPDLPTFRELLDAVPEESVHVVLDNHLRPKYQEGVFEYDKAALERVHDDNPSLASKLVIYAAKLELLKRQNSNATVASTTAESSVTPPPVDTSSKVTPPATSVIPATTSTPSPGGSSSQAGSSTPVTSAQSSAAPQSTPIVSVEVPVTTTDSAGKVFVTSTPQPALIISTTNSAGQATVITTPSPTKGQLVTATDSHGSTFLTTYTPDGGLVSSLVVLTTTLPNGDVATITSYAVVNGNPTKSAASTNKAPSSTRGAPGLQSGAANVLSRNKRAEAAALIGGAFGVVWLL